MDSITKIKLDKNSIEKLVEKAFGVEYKVNEFYEITEGWYNTIYSILLNNQMEVVLKIAPPTDVKILRYEKNIMKTEVQILRLLKEKTKVPVPTVYFYHNSDKVMEHEYFFMEKVAGKPYSKIKESISLEMQKHIEIELGNYNRSINEITGKRFGYFSQSDKTAETWFDAFHIMIKDILLDGQEYNVKLPIDYRQIEDLVANYSFAFASVKTPRLVHWDLHDGNVIVGDDGNIAGIIDCDRAIWGDPLIEFYFQECNNHENFIKGYGDLFYCDENVLIRRRLYNVYLYLIVYIESYYRNYDDSHKKWAYEQLEREIRLLKI